MPKSKELPVESYFLRYAFPCTYIIRQRGDINAKTFDMLEKAAMKNTKVKRRLLESVYKKAFARIRKVARSMKKSYWDRRVIEEYFLRRHNSMIDDGDGGYGTAPKAFRDFCKVHRATIIEKREKFLIVKYGKGRTRVVGSFFVPDAKPGDKVTIHHGFAVEKLEDA